MPIVLINYAVLTRNWDLNLKPGGGGARQILLNLELVCLLFLLIIVVFNRFSSLCTVMNMVPVLEYGNSLTVLTVPYIIMLCPV
jgi:hypothetical protein